MDEQLQLRLDVYRGMDDIPDQVVNFVATELSGLTIEYRITDETAGMMTSHLVMALKRMVTHEPDIEGPAPAVYERVAAESPASVRRAVSMSDQAAASLGTRLSPIEEQYLTFHLATLAITAQKEQP